MASSCHHCVIVCVRTSEGRMKVRTTLSSCHHHVVTSSDTQGRGRVRTGLREDLRERELALVVIRVVLTVRW